MDLRTGDREPPQVTLLILDACRNDPMIPSGFKSLSTPSGLATITPPKGTFIMYSADAGGTALDRIEGEDDEPLSLYTRTLIPLMQDPQLSLQELAVKVREKVSTQAEARQHEQWPAYYDQLRGRFCIPGCQTLLAADKEPTAEASMIASNSLASSRNKVSSASSKSLEAKGGPRMVMIPGGTFLMGSPESEVGRDSDEGPQHHVTVPAFELGETEVTFAEWDRCVSAGACPQKSDNGWGRGMRPVINVSWNDAQTYIAWLNAKVGLTGSHAYRLPSEAEWEYAAKSGAKQDVWAGTSEKSNVGDYAVYEANSGGKTAEVRSKKPNAFGLYDLSGNVLEWMHDCYVNSYESAPTDGSGREMTASGTCAKRVLRGGSWYGHIPLFLRSAVRFRFPPDEAGFVSGFRLARLAHLRSSVQSAR